MSRGDKSGVRFTEEQIIEVLKEHEAGAKTADLARKHGVSEATPYNWKAKYGGMNVSEVNRRTHRRDYCHFYKVFNAQVDRLLTRE